MPISDDLRFAFDVQGYLHLRGVLTPDELAEYGRWMDETEHTDVQALNADDPDRMKYHVNRPVSRIIDAAPQFGRFLDHPAVEPFLAEFLGPDYRHIDNELYYTHPEYQGGHWHRGVRPHPTGHVLDGQFICPMVKVFYCMTDVGPDEGEFVIIPGSHRAQFTVDAHDRIDLPAQHVFNDVKAGDIILFNEGLLHNGRPNPSRKTRKTIIVNFGRGDAGVWAGYAPLPQTLDAVTPRQREILTNRTPVWSQPDLLQSVPVALRARMQ
ncbi:MAG: phytanoyl-CoA dioxygenase family protein [Candidatus Latescibacteria bacterium]|nr:phytanoyl-CoA dioxygenase family protein [Candidatus Latescibacterota bacterium]